MDTQQHALQLLEQLEQALKTHQHWQHTLPADSALASTEPFAVDTLTCGEWLQWIFLPKMRVMLEQDAPIPSNISIAPYVEEAMKHNMGRDDIAAILAQFDSLFQAGAK
ncbi:YqcC family protein [Veronia pacifica]|uniref:Pseudouridine synthase n=1 Tax=Veronia pacifica TaxID=1080227 RepID=A0A1C3EI68_9GAMM|nr:YqcC family protein [Veronia pacifica]ODA32931.1 pseudouridine synthase [Veronia pacifica]